MMRGRLGESTMRVMFVLLAWLAMCLLAGCPPAETDDDTSGDYDTSGDDDTSEDDECDETNNRIELLWPACP